MTIGVLLVLAQTALQLRIQYRDIHDLRTNESKEIQEVRREINVWRRAAANLPSFPKKGDVVRNTLLAKVKFMEHKLKKLELSGTDSNEAYKCTLDELKQSVSGLTRLGSCLAISKLFLHVYTNSIR